MDFLKPTYLYLLFVIPLLLILYILRLRRKTHVVSSCLLWEQAIEDMKANTPFQRLRRNLLLPLQIIFLALAIFALARPFLRGTIAIAQNTILIMDSSASMKASDVGESRFEEAKSAAAKMVDHLSDGARMMIIEAGSSPRIVLGFTSDKLQLQRALNEMRPTDAAVDLDPAIRMASSISRDIEKCEILLLSDGASLNSIETIRDNNAPIRFIGFGKKNADNVGITDLEVRQSPGDTSERQVFAVVQNFSIFEKRSLLLELYHDDNLVDVRELSLTPGERRSVVFDSLKFAEGVLRAFLDVDDHLSVDNYAYYIMHRPGSFRTLLVSSGNPFLEQAISTVSYEMEIFTAHPETYAAHEENELAARSTYNLTVFDGFIPENLPEGNLMFVNPGGDLPFGSLVSDNDNPAVIDWDRSSPVMRFIELSNLRVDKSYSYEMLPWMKPLLETDVGTIAWLGERDSQRIIVLSFDVQPRPYNNFSMLVAFPIFMSNSLEWLMGSRESLQRQAHPGSPLKLILPREAQRELRPPGIAITVRKPNGEQVKIQPKTTSIVFRDTDQVGIYEFTGDGFEERFAVNLLNEAESQIEPADRVEIAGQEIASSDIHKISNREIWNGMIFVSLMLLAIEWWVYHRRVLV